MWRIYPINIYITQFDLQPLLGQSLLAFGGEKYEDLIRVGLSVSIPYVCLHNAQSYPCVFQRGGERKWQKKRSCYLRALIGYVALAVCRMATREAKNWKDTEKKMLLLFFNIFVSYNVKEGSIGWRAMRVFY